MLCGLVAIKNMLLHGSLAESLAEYQDWIALSVATACVVTGIGFIFGRTWARRSMDVLMVVAMLLFLDVLLMSGWSGNRQGAWQVLVALGLAGYTLLFLLISAGYRDKDSR